MDLLSASEGDNKIAWHANDTFLDYLHAQDTWPFLLGRWIAKVRNGYAVDLSLPKTPSGNCTRRPDTRRIG